MQRMTRWFQLVDATLALTTSAGEGRPSVGGGPGSGLRARRGKAERPLLTHGRPRKATEGCWP